LFPLHLPWQVMEEAIGGKNRYQLDKTRIALGPFLGVFLGWRCGRHVGLWILTFGGYWAWDPVENAYWFHGWYWSRVFTHYLFTNRDILRATHLFFIISFGLVLYSFLTVAASWWSIGACVHRPGYELIVLSYYLPGPFALAFFSRYKEIPTIKKEESGSSGILDVHRFIGILSFCYRHYRQRPLPVLNKILAGL
jgi:cytochrome c-type biogenesis protein CcmF